MNIGSRFGCSALAAAAFLLFGSASANAAVLYENPIPVSSSPQNIDAWTINFGYIVADTFTLSSNSTVNGVDFQTWNFPDDSIDQVGWSITSGANSGTIFGSGTASVSAILLTSNNGFGYKVDWNSFSISDIGLLAGTYWLNLQNAAVASGNPVYWDQGGGASQAWESSLGNLTYNSLDNQCHSDTGQTYTATNGSCAETFDVVGTGSQPVPEPVTLSLFGAGLAGVTSLRRRKKKVA